MLRRAVHPGEILKDELAEIGVSPERFAREVSLPAGTVIQIINGQHAISRNIAARIGKRLGVDPQFWLNLQTHFNSINAPRRQERPSPSATDTLRTPPPQTDEPQPF